MATRLPARKTAKKPTRPSTSEGLNEIHHDIGPRHDLADAIESVYEERHRKPAADMQGFLTRKVRGKSLTALLLQERRLDLEREQAKFAKVRKTRQAK
jgi:hypothetical protein